jgi:tetratricopeptide (TPR) repeat protein
MAHVRRAEALVDQGEYEAAVAACNEAIRLDSRLTAAYLVRGEAYRLKGMYPQSLADCDTAIRLDPANAQAYAQRGEGYRMQGDHDRALADCNRALQFDPRLAWAYTVRGAVHEDRKAYALAAADWEESLRLEPNHAWTNSRLAWLLATCPDGRERHGQRAVKIAQRACELTEWKDADALASLAAAHAECGAFQDAIRQQEKAVSLTSGQQKEFYTALLNMYRTSQPYREDR